MANLVPVKPEPKFLEANLVPTRTGFQCMTRIPAGAGILQIKFRQKLNLHKSKNKLSWECHTRKYKLRSNLGHLDRCSK